MERRLSKTRCSLQTVFRNQDILECLIRKSPSISTSQNVLDGPIKAIFFLLVSPVRPQVKGEAMRTLAVFAKHKPSTSRFIWTMLKATEILQPSPRAAFGGRKSGPGFSKRVQRLDRRE